MIKLKGGASEVHVRRVRKTKKGWRKNGSQAYKAENLESTQNRTGLKIRLQKRESSFGRASKLRAKQRCSIELK